MFRYHRVLYRRLLRGQSTGDLTRLRLESRQFPTLVHLIDDELSRREREAQAETAPGATVNAFRPHLGAVLSN